MTILSMLNYIEWFFEIQFCSSISPVPFQFLQSCRLLSFSMSLDQSRINYLATNNELILIYIQFCIVLYAINAVWLCGVYCNRIKEFVKLIVTLGCNQCKNTQLMSQAWYRPSANGFSSFVVLLVLLVLLAPLFGKFSSSVWFNSSVGLLVLLVQ